VRVEFCEADVLDAFDDWRRAVGVALRGSSAGDVTDNSTSAGDDGEGPGRRRPSLAGHIERVVARLTALRASSQAASPVQDVLEDVVRQLDGLQGNAKRARGETREAMIAHLRVIDQTLMTAVMESIGDEVRAAAEAEAKAALAPFRDRMVPDAYQRARVAAIERHVREHLRLPVIAFEL